LSGAYVILRTPCRKTAKFGTQTRTDHVQNIYWVLYLKGSSFTKKTTFFIRNTWN